MKRKRAAGLMLAALIVAISLAFLSSRSSTEGQLIQVCPLEQYDSGYTGTFGNDGYLWLNSHELLLHSKLVTSSPQSHVPLPQPLGPINVYDTVGQQHQAAGGLNQVLGTHTISASPDGRWVLCNTQVVTTSPVGMAAVRRADGKRVDWPNLQMWNSVGFWMPDSRRWVGVNYVPTGHNINGHPMSERRLVIYDVNHPGFKSFPIPQDTGREDIMGVTPQGKIIFNDTMDLGYGPAKNALLSLREVSLDGPQPTARTFQVPVPDTPASFRSRLALSPSGDRLLWSCYSSKPNSLMSWIDYWTHHSYLGGAASQDIWICKLDGSAPHHVGTYSNPSIGFSAAWNPDGQHVSLTEQGSLYNVFVP